MNDSYIKNDKQLFFNQIRGIIEEINDGEEYCSITLRVGHDNSRNVNLTMKKNFFDKVISDFKIEDKVSVRFYVSSRKKHERWYTTVNVLDIHKDN